MTQKDLKTRVLGIVNDRIVRLGNNHERILDFLTDRYHYNYGLVRVELSEKEEYCIREAIKTKRYPDIHKYESNIRW